MAGNAKRFLLTLVLILTALFVAVGIGLMPVNLFFAKPSVERLITENLGMELELRGPLRLSFGLAPTLTASAITLRKGSDPAEQFLTIDQVQVSPRLWSVLGGEIFLRDVKAEGVDLDYCQRFEGLRKVEESSSDSFDSMPPIAIDHLSLQGIRLVCSDKSKEFSALPQSFDLKATADLNEPVEISLTGRRLDEPFRLALSTGSLSEILESPPSLPFELEFEDSEFQLGMTGTISSPFSEPEVRAKTELLSGLLERHTGIASVSFSALVRGFGSRPYIELDAGLDQIDLQYFVGGNAETQTSDEAQSFQPLFEVLSRFDALANVRVGRLLNSPLAVETLTLEAKLDDSVLNLDRAEWMLGGAPVTATAQLDMHGDCPRLTSAMKLTDLDISQLNQLSVVEDELDGKVGAAELGSSSCGSTLLQHVESLKLTFNATDVDASRGGEALPLSVDSMEFNANWREPGQLSLEGNLLGEPLSSSALFGSIESILSDEAWPLDLNLDINGNNLGLAGQVGFAGDVVDLDVNLQFAVSRFGSLHNWIGADPGNDLALKGQTHLKLDGNGLSLTNYKVTLGTSDISGNLSWAGPQSGRPAALDLNSSNLDLSELAGLFPDTPDAYESDNLGGYELLTQSEWLEAWFDLPQADIRFSIMHIDGFYNETHNITARASLRDRHVEDGKLRLEFEDVEFDGSFYADLRQRPWELGFSSVLSNIDIGRVLSALDLTDKVDASARQMDIELTSRGSTLQELAENSLIQSKMEGVSWEFEAGAEDQRHQVDLSTLELIIKPNAPTTWQASGLVNEVPFRAWMKTPSLRTTFNPAAELPLTLVLGAGQDLLMFDSVIHRPTSAGRKIDLFLSGEWIDTQGLDFSQLQVPLKDFHVGTTVEWRGDEFLFSNLDLKMGSSRASGKIDIRYTEPAYVFDIDLDSSFLETDDLVQWAEDWRRERRLSVAEPEEAAVNELSDKPEEAGLLTLVVDAFARLTDSRSFDLNINVDELRSSGLLLGHAEMNLHMDDKEIHLSPLQITSDVAQAVANYHVVSTETEMEQSLDIDIDGLQYGGLLRLLNPDIEMTGELYLVSSLSSRSASMEGSAGNLEGDFDLAIFPENIEAGFLDLWASNLIFALLPAVGESNKKMNCLVARFEVEEGVMTSKNTFLDSTDIIVRAKGEIDLGRREVDLWLAPQAKVEKFLSISTPIAVKGPFSDFNVGVAPGGFLTSMFRLYYGLIYVPWKWLTGERYPADGIATCYKAMDWELPLQE